MINLAKEKGWKFAVASFENQPDIHIAKLISKIVGKPFFQGLQPRLSQKELEYGKRFLKDHFSFVYQADGSLPTLESLLERLRYSVLKDGIKGCVIDPYNYINRSNVDEKETDWVSSMLSHTYVVYRSSYQDDERY